MFVYTDLGVTPGHPYSDTLTRYLSEVAFLGPRQVILSGTKPQFKSPLFNKLIEKYNLIRQSITPWPARQELGAGHMILRFDQTLEVDGVGRGGGGSFGTQSFLSFL
jgi:hypothetical protein